MSTTVRQRNRRGEGERLRQALLDAASELLAESPDVERLSVRAITARAGVTATALYLHFSDKDDLARAVKKRCFGELANALQSGYAEADGDPPAQLRALARAYLHYASENPGHYAMMFHSAKSGQGPASTPAEDIRAAGLETFSLLVQAITNCGLHTQSAHEHATVLWLALHGRAAIQQTMPWFPLPAEDRFIELIVGAIGK
jgi:AcrR family transcriptional regulator